MRLREGAVLQRARSVLDSVHDARLVLAPAKREAEQGRGLHGGRLRERKRDVSAAAQAIALTAALVAERTPRRGSAHGGTDYLARAPPDDAQQRDGVVGCIADLRLRRDLAQAREARSGDAAKLCSLRRPSARAPASSRATCRCFDGRADPPCCRRLGRAGSDRLPGQLDDRHQLLPQRVRPRAQRASSTNSARRRPRRPTPIADFAILTRPTQVIRYRNVTADELFEAARLVVSAGIAKIHTIEWTPQLLYDEPLYLGMNAQLVRAFPRPRASWNGARAHHRTARHAPPTRRPAQRSGTRCSPPGRASSASAAPATSTATLEPGQPGHVNGGVNHFGSPFNFPEEFVTVYRLHALVPDLIEYRDWDADPNRCAARSRSSRPSARKRHPGDARARPRELGTQHGPAAAGRADAAATTPQFLQNLDHRRGSRAATKQIDVAALDLIRDRERGVPRFNEFRRQIRAAAS